MGSGNLVLSSGSPSLAAGRKSELDRIARGLVRDARSATTIAAYDRDWQAFAAWCAEHGETPMPATAATVVRYIAALVEAGRRPATITRYVSSISVRHRAANVPNPAMHEAVRLALDGARRRLGTAQRKKAPLTTDLLGRVFADLDPAAAADQQDRVILLFVYAGALRRSELVALDLDDITVDADGIRLRIARSKTDQAGAGVEVGIVFGDRPGTCPVTAWQTWRRTLTAAGITAGPAFRTVSPRGHVSATRMSARTVANIIKRRVAAVGLDPSAFAGHSGRRGFATAAARAGADERAVMRQGRWRSRRTLDGYVDEGRLFEGNASARLGL